MARGMDGKIYNSIGPFLKERFGCRVVKLSIDGGFTCPNRDGTKGLDGCIFCSAEGSGELASEIADIETQINLLSHKWPDSKYIAYFQSHTNTYASVDVLRAKYEEALQFPGVVGLAIATRPDCITEEVYDLLDELNRKTFLWIELGLQTIHEETSALINRCYPLDDFNKAMEKLSSLNIKTVVHLILGLPGETKEMMRDSLDYVCAYKPFGLKLHMLNVIKGSQLEKLYPDYVSFHSIEEYVDLVVSLIKRLPPEITIHRLTGDVPRALLISPTWSYKKRTILNEIHNSLRKTPGL